MNTGKLTAPFRKLGLMHFLDRVKYQIQKRKNAASNKAFLKDNPDVVLPPDYMMFESFQLNYQKYYEGGKSTAQWLKTEIEAFEPVNNKVVVDWGCGPARVLRHLPEVFGNGCQYFGTDYNQDTINWCKANIPNIDFRLNGINPPLQYESDFCDVIYAISIFTHLSKPNHQNWYDELMRISRKGCILLLTTHGDAYKAILTEAEKKDFEKGQLVTRGQVVEGHRVFAAFHPPAYIRQLFGSKAEILKHQPGVKKEWGIEQDLWLLRTE